MQDQEERRKTCHVVASPHFLVEERATDILYSIETVYTSWLAISSSRLSLPTYVDAFLGHHQPPTTLRLPSIKHRLEEQALGERHGADGKGYMITQIREIVMVSTYVFTYKYIVYSTVLYDVQLSSTLGRSGKVYYLCTVLYVHISTYNVSIRLN